jgi:EAL domain-containing protein (putative c-di-GMP-specific phosphodiesterase class I)
VCTGVDGPSEAADLADRIRSEVGGRFAIEDQEVFVTVSIGVALATGKESAEELLRDADAAMYEAKARGRDRVQVFDAGVRARVVERLDIEQALRYAIERDELVLEFQPVVGLPHGKIRGVEALVRWDHPQRGLLLPGQFLGVAEETGLIIDVGRWVLTEACRLARHMLFDPDTDEPLPLFVNLSPRQLADKDLVPMVRDVIDLTGVDPRVLHLEITEDALMADAATTSTTLDQLHALGVRLALDDFGTGHSSLAYLKQFPVEVLKIDRTFVEGLGQDSDDRAITAAIVNVARMLGLSTVAEGVERPDQAAELTALGCDLAQGFHFARPMYASELELVLPRRVRRISTNLSQLTNHGTQDHAVRRSS